MTTLRDRRGGCLFSLDFKGSVQEEKILPLGSAVSPRRFTAPFQVAFDILEMRKSCQAGARLSYARSRSNSITQDGQDEISIGIPSESKEINLGPSFWGSQVDLQIRISNVLSKQDKSLQSPYTSEPNYPTGASENFSGTFSL